MSTAVSPRAMAQLLAPLLAFDVRARLGEIDVPTLVVVGTAGPAHAARTRPRRHGRTHSRRARLEVLEGCGHLVMLERAEQLDALLGRFSAELAA